MSGSYLSLKDTLSMCQRTGKAVSLDEIHSAPLRCLRLRDDGKAYDVVPYAGEEYIAISYSWPVTGWARLHDSNTPCSVFRSQSDYPSKCPNFSAFAQKAVRDEVFKPASLIWLDYECIDHGHGDEKAGQVHSMNKIYSQAWATVILLEDVEMSMAEFDLLQTTLFSRVTAHFNEYAQIVRRILSARWFSRAWCTQELILSRSPTFFMHHCDEPLGPPIRFSLPTLKHWMGRAAMHDPSIAKLGLSDSRGLNPEVTRAGYFGNAIAWAFGAVYSKGCLNPYDKIALVDNLTYADLSSRIVGLPAEHPPADSTVENNVIRIVNVLAILRGDYSLLLTGHVVGNPLQRVEGFGWAGPSLRGDILCESWSPRGYEVEKAGDSRSQLDACGLTLRGIASEVLEQVDWSFSRDAEGLHVTISGEHHLVTSDWLRKKYPTSRPLQPGHAFFRDLCYLIEAFNLVDIYRLAFDAVNDEWFHDPAYGDLKTHIQRHFSGYSPSVLFYASRLVFMREGGKCGFTVVTLAGNTKLLVRGNVSELRGRLLFQPYVMRPKEFSAILPTVNSLVLDGNNMGGAFNCVGGVRGFGLIPASTEEIELRVR